MSAPQDFDINNNTIISEQNPVAVAAAVAATATASASAPTSSTKTFKKEKNSENKEPKKKLQGPKRDQILDLEQYKDQHVRVQLAGNITVAGILKSYDAAMNMILDDAVEYIADELDLTKLLRKRSLGLCVLRGTLLVMISPDYTFTSTSSE